MRTSASRLLSNSRSSLNFGEIALLIRFRILNQLVLVDRASTLSCLLECNYGLGSVHFHY